MQTKRTTIPDALRLFDDLPDCAKVRLPVVKGLLSCSSATVWRMVASQKLPAPQKISPGVTCWSVGELRRTLAGGAS